ncbi:MAG: hypothetical protein AB7I30_23535 [Isosphaeraceae bacterium]
MSNPRIARRTQDEVLNRDCLEIRSRILDLAAALDRHDRATAGSPHPDPRMHLIHEGLEVLLHPDPDRAETIQTLFSLGYDPDWRAQFGLPGGKPSNGR